MLSPTTVSFSLLALVLGERPLRTGVWFYAGAFLATVAVGVAGALVIGDAAAGDHGSRPDWVSVVDIAAGVLLAGYGFRFLRQPPDDARRQAMIDRMSEVTSSPAIAIVAAGATLANPGGFIPIALKTISEMDPGRPGYVALWLVFTVVSLLPLGVAVVALAVMPVRTGRVLRRLRDWLLAHARTVAAGLILALAAALVGNGIAGLAS